MLVLLFSFDFLFRRPCQLFGDRGEVLEDARRAVRVACHGAIKKVESGVTGVEGEFDSSRALLVSFFVEAVARDVLEGGALRSGKWNGARLLE